MDSLKKGDFKSLFRIPPFDKGLCKRVTSSQKRPSPKGEAADRLHPADKIHPADKLHP